MGKFVHTIGNVFLTILIMLLIVYGWAFIEVKLLLKSQPELFGYVFYQQQDESMSPNFESTDVVLVKKNVEYQTGDIVLYFDSNDSLYKAQAIVAMDNKTITTKCSMCNENSEPISKDNIVGKAVGKVLFMGAIIQFFKQKAVLIGFGLIGVVLLVISQYVEFKPNKKEKEEKKSLQNSD